MLAGKIPVAETLIYLCKLFLHGAVKKYESITFGVRKNGCYLNRSTIFNFFVVYRFLGSKFVEKINQTESTIKCL